MHKLIRHYEKRMNERKQSLPKHDISCGRMTEAGRTETHDRNEVNMDDDDDETHRNGNITSSPDDNEHNVRQNKMKSPVPQSRKKSDEVPATPTETHATAHKFGIFALGKILSKSTKCLCLSGSG